LRIYLFFSLSQFQLDGNLGVVAAICELLLQSNIPGVISLLPAIPISLSGSNVIFEYCQQY
jgi:hypothetical protein